MRFYEFADAEAQLGLLKVIIDNTWSAIAQQAAAEKQANDQRRAQAKFKRGPKSPQRRNTAAKRPAPTPKAPPAKTAGNAPAAASPPAAQRAAVLPHIQPIKPLTAPAQTQPR